MTQQCYETQYNNTTNTTLNINDTQPNNSTNTTLSINDTQHKATGQYDEFRYAQFRYSGLSRF